MNYGNSNYLSAGTLQGNSSKGGFSQSVESRFGKRLRKNQPGGPGSDLGEMLPDNEFNAKYNKLKANKSDVPKLPEIKKKLNYRDIMYPGMTDEQYKKMK